ncbi:MAG TPA: M48 family metallopeptidase [Candidatus Dormibacteraeota bacterium]|nr:M48 family metallopeptidase [Candidatus Dormibacteraeota bacterium]
MSLRTRAVLAVALTVGFYVLALGLIAGLIAIVFIPNVPGRVVGFSIIGALVIAVSIVPRPNRFEPPGPLLNPAGQPRLFAELEGVARAVGEAMPAEVYVTPEVNAGVLQRGRRRVMVLGLPLMQIMTVSQMRAVLAHEFGHYYGGDTKLGPWVYRTRETIERTLRTVSQQSALLQLPFLWYGRLFMRVSQGVSRQQEFAADQLAARTIGAGAMIAGLRNLGQGSIAFNVYWRQEVVPLIEGGFRPPLADGFTRFLAVPEVMKRVAEAAHEQLAQAKTDPYDSHPPDAERIAALAALPAGPDYGNEPAAITLVDGVEAIDQVLLVGVLKPGLQLRAISWTDAGTVALLPGLRERARRQAGLVGSYTVGWLPELLKYADRLGHSEAKAAGTTVAEDRAHSLGIGLAGAAFATALAQNGWTGESLPGRPLLMRHGDATMEPFVEVNRLARGEEDADTWQRRCWDLGIRDLSMMPL